MGGRGADTGGFLGLRCRVWGGGRRTLRDSWGNLGLELSAMGEGGGGHWEILGLELSGLGGGLGGRERRGGEGIREGNLTTLT